MALTITVEISTENQAILDHNLLDVNDWVQQAVIGKVSNCTKRLAEEAQQVLLADPAVTSMPATSEGMIAEYMARPDYMNRAEREAAILAAQE